MVDNWLLTLYSSLYFVAADLDALSRVLGGSQEKQESPLASLTVTIEDKVPLGSRHERVGVLFSLINFLLQHYCVVCVISTERL